MLILLAALQVATSVPKPNRPSGSAFAQATVFISVSVRPHIVVKPTAGGYDIRSNTNLRLSTRNEGGVLIVVAE